MYDEVGYIKGGKSVKDKINKIKKSCKHTKILLIVIMVLMSISFIFNGVYLIKGIVHPKESYRLEVQLDDFEDKEHHLIVNEKDFGVVDIEEFNQTNVENRETNYKACFIIGGVNYLIKIIIVMCIILFVSMIMNDIEKDCRPFTKRNIWRLRIISVLVMVFAITPGMIKISLTFFVFLKAGGAIDTIDILLILIGIAIGAISMLFEYGNAVQEEMDSIA